MCSVDDLAFDPGRTKAVALARRLQRDVVSAVVDGVDEAVLAGVLGLQDVVPVGVLRDLFDRLPGVLYIPYIFTIAHKFLHES
jgi:hypothetical protein